MNKAVQTQPNDDALDNALEVKSQAFVDKIIQNSRLSLLGQMTAGITHELKNPLAVIRLKMDRLLLNLEECCIEDQEKIRPHLALIEKNVQKIINITDQIRNLSGNPDEKYNKVNINLILSEITNTYKRFSKENMVLTDLHLEAQAPECFGSQTQLEHVFLHLIQNAHESFKKWGSGSMVTIKTHDEGNTIIIDVSDDGVGIPKAQKAEIFNPFYTTKEDGLGLGLTTVEKIIHNHGGTIRLLDSSVGAHFQITLPHDRRRSQDRL